MGPSSGTCWEYDRPDFTACFSDSQVNAMFGVVPGASSPEHSDGAISIGTHQETVGRLLGKPDILTERYAAQKNGYETAYWGAFREGKLIEFKEIPQPPVD
jgi:hypothetical protein